MSDTDTATTQLDLPPAVDPAASPSGSLTSEASASENTASTSEASPDQPKAEKAKRRPRRGPPADGAPEPRVTVLLTTSRLSSVDGSPLRRGQAVSVPVRRLDALIAQGKVRQGSAGEVDAAQRRAPLGELG